MMLQADLIEEYLLYIHLALEPFDSLRSQAGKPTAV
jgi:hypothetical protein